MLEDLIHTFRSLRRAPGFAAVVLLTLALGIGANTAIFSVLYGMLLRPLPYPDAEQLVGLVQTWPGGRGETGVTYPQYRDLAEQLPGLASVGAATSVGMNLFTGSVAAHVSANRVSANYFRTLGLTPSLGRDFAADEDQVGGARAVILGHQLWQQRFGGDRAVVGSSIRLDGEPYTVVGVMPADYLPEGGAELWTTLAQVSRTIGSGQNLEIVGRLKAGFTVASARAAQINALAAWAKQYNRAGQQGVGYEIDSYRALIVGDLGVPIKLLFGATALVLLIACANVANLILGRGAARSRELAVRAAMGASRGRLLRQLMTESFVISIAGGALGFLFAVWGLDALLALVPQGLPRIGSIGIDGRTLVFTLVLSAITGLIFGAIPAWQATRSALYNTLKDESGRTTGSRGQGRLRHTLVELEVALSLVLLVGAGLLIRTFANLTHTEAGFETEHVVSAELWLTGARFDSTAGIRSFYGDLTRRLEALPGVQAAAVIEAGLPLQRGGNVALVINGDREHIHGVDYRTVTENFFSALGVPVKQGRGFSELDGAGAPLVAVVNQAFVKKYLKDGVALGQQVDVERSGVDRTVVGVVGDVRSFIGADPIATVYLPSAQTPAGLTKGFTSWFPIHIMVRTTGDPGAIASAIGPTVRAADPEVPVGRIRTMAQVLASSLALERFLMLVSGLFAGLALMLASIGMYGVIAYLVTQRTREIGIRMALGATAGDVRRMVVGSGMRLTLVGIGGGLLGAIALKGVIASQLYAVEPRDPVTLALVTLAVTLIALLASYLPARRATAVDPVIALRRE